MITIEQVDIDKAKEEKLAGELIARCCPAVQALRRNGFVVHSVGGEVYHDGKNQHKLKGIELIISTHSSMWQDLLGKTFEIES